MNRYMQMPATLVSSLRKGIGSMLVVMLLVGNMYAQSPQLDLFNFTIVSEKSYTAQQTITLGPDVVIASTGKATFGAPDVYILSDLKVVSGGSMYITPQVLAVDIDEGLNTSSLAIDHAYPNPFDQSVTLAYNLDQAGQVEIQVVDMVGKQVKALMNDYMLPGEHVITWNGTNQLGAQMANGMYSIIISIGHTQATERVVLLR